jgi:hypothetical protein
MPTLSRRQWLRGAGSLLLAAPFYQLLSPRMTARAAGQSRRLIVCFSPNGSILKHWRPTGSGTNFSFPAGSILEPLAMHQAQLTVIDGLNFERVRGGSHEGGMEHMLTGGGGPSVDQFIASKVGTSAPFSSIELGVQTSAWGASVQTRMAYNAAHEYVHPEDDPVATYARLFGGVSATPGEVDVTRKNKQSVIDLVRGELNDLENALGNTEKQKLDAHLEALRTLERRLDGSNAVTCGSVTAPTVMNAKDNAGFPDVGAAQIDMLVAAAACDLSRVLSLQWSHTVSPAILSWAGVSEGHHELSHKDDTNTAGVADFIQSERWFAAQFATLLDKLAATQEADGSGSLLDTSTVIWVKELADSRLHDFNGVPFVLAGGGNGYWKQGQYLTFSGTPHQKLLVSLCQSMGVDVESFGVDDITGALPGLTG